MHQAVAQLQHAPFELHGLDVEAKRRADSADILVIQLPDDGRLARVVQAPAVAGRQLLFIVLLVEGKQYLHPCARPLTP